VRGAAATLLALCIARCAPDDARSAPLADPPAAAIAVPNLILPAVAAPPRSAVISFAATPQFRRSETAKRDLLPLLAGTGAGVAPFALLADRSHSILAVGSSVGGSTVTVVDANGAQLADGRRLTFPTPQPAGRSTDFSVYEVPAIEPAPAATAPR
jgi:hypothetical protein